MDQARDAVNAVDVDLQATKGGLSTTYATLSELQNVVLGQIPDGSITIPKLSFDPATQVELDTTNSNLTAHLADYVRQPGYINPTGGTSTAYTGSTTPALSAYSEGIGVTIIPHIDCGSSPTLNWDGKGATALLKQDGTAYTAGEMVAGRPYTFKKVGTSFLADSSGGLSEFYGDGSDGAIPNLNTCTTAPNGGTVANLWDMNSSTTFTTGTLSSASDQVVFTMDFGSPQVFTSVSSIPWAVSPENLSISTGVRNIALQYSSDNITWYQYGAVTAVGTSPANYAINYATAGAYRYWRLVLKSGGSDCTLTITNCMFNRKSSGDLVTSFVWRIFYLVTSQSEVVVKNFATITIPAGYEIITDNPCQGLILYSQGDVNISGTIDMSQKAGLAPNGGIIPMVLTKKNSTGTATIDKYFKLSTILQALKGGSGGNGGYGGGYSGSIYRQTLAGTGGAGRQNLGGFGGGGGGGAYSLPLIGGAGGSIDFAELGGGVARLTSTNVSGPQVSIDGFNGAGGISPIGGGSFTVTSGKCCGGGGGGLAPVQVASTGKDGQYAGGFILIIAKGTITINAGAFIKANGGNGGNGYASTLIDSGGGGGGGGAGGGVIALLYKTAYVNNGTIQANGGSGGSGGAKTGAGEVGGSGASGSVGTILTQQL